MAPSPPCCACRITYSFYSSVTMATGEYVAATGNCYFSYGEARVPERSADYREIEWKAEQERIRLALAKAKRLSHEALEKLMQIVEYVCPSQPRQQAKRARWLGLLQRK